MENDLFVKPIYRSSSLINYPKCPKKYDLSTKHPLGRTDAMVFGLLFEGYVFGFKDDNQKELEGRRHAKTLDPLKRKADQLNEIFQFDGESYIKYELEYEELIAKGELDFKGHYTLDGERKYGILDLKLTKSIERIWNTKGSKADFFQSAFYPMLDYLSEDKDPSRLIDFEEQIFLYLVCELNDFQDVFYNVYPIRIDNKAVMWAWEQLRTVHQAASIGYPANESSELCLGWSHYGSKCGYIEWCEEGKDLIRVKPHQGYYDFSQRDER